MNTNKFILTLSFVFLFIIDCLAQDTTGLSRKNWKIDKIPYPGYSFSLQKENTHQLSLEILHTPKKNRQNYHYNNRLGMGVGIVFSKNNKFSNFSPSINLNYYLPLKQKKEFGLYTSLNYWQTNTGAVLDQRLTPEIGLSFYTLTVSYGYNLPLATEKLMYSRNKVTFKFIRQ